MPLLIRGEPRDAAVSRALELLAEVGLAAVLNIAPVNYPAANSSG